MVLLLNMPSRAFSLTVLLLLIFFFFLLGNSNGSEAAGELQRHHNVLRECIEQLKAVESSRATLISYLQEALHEQVVWTLKFILLSFVQALLYNIYYKFKKLYHGLYSGIEVWAVASTTSGMLSLA